MVHMINFAKHILLSTLFLLACFANPILADEAPRFQFNILPNNLSQSLAEYTRETGIALGLKA
ncbi:MAG: hypothetical protein COA84_07205 [Robiginitomaculum sp.]|nr:MAG: hypothetical protein COA84_07205 [Robiginitomaculum sp.]